MKVNHTGIIVDSIEKNLNIYSTLGFIIMSEKVVDTVQHNYIQFIINSDSKEIIELVQPINENSTVFKNKGLHHICYEVKDFDSFLMKFKKERNGVIFTEKINAPAFNNRNIVFAYLKNGVIVEFLESE